MLGLTNNTQIRNMWEKLPTVDSDIIELLSRRSVIYTGSENAGYRTLNTLMKQEKDPLVIAEHLEGEALMQFEHEESTERNKKINWLLSASAIYSNEARSKLEENVFTIDDSARTSSIKPHNEKKWWNRIVGGALALSLGVTALYAGMKGPAPEHPPIHVPPPIEETIQEHDPSIPQKGIESTRLTDLSVVFPFHLQDIESLKDRMRFIGYPVLPHEATSKEPLNQPIEIAELPFLHPEREVYVVKKGDNLNTIAGMFLTEECDTPNNRHAYALQLAASNELSNPDFIIPGQPILITAFDKSSLREYTPTIEDKIEGPIRTQGLEDEGLEPIRADGPTTGLLAIGHDDKIPNAVFNYGEIEPGTIPGVNERIVTDMLGVPGIGERVNEYWKENVSDEGIHYGTPEQSTTNPLIVPKETRENADRIRYGDSLDDIIDNNDIDDSLIRDDEYIPMNNSDSSSYGKPGDFHIGSMIQLQYVMSKNPHSEYNENLSAHNLSQMIARGERIDSAYSMKQDGLSNSEIAEELGVGISTVRKYIAEANRIVKETDKSQNSEAYQTS